MAAVLLVQGACGVGAVVGSAFRYHPMGRLGAGGMAELHVARMESPDGMCRPVVLKRPLPVHTGSKSADRVFLDEARTLAGVRHRNVVDVIDFRGERDPYICMELLLGESGAGLLRRLHRERLALPWSLGSFIVAEVCAGLHAAHGLRRNDGRSAAFVHRDISPQNIFITYDGEVKLIDFGIAKTAGRSENTEPGQLKGKFGYMSPEQINSDAIDRRSDVFALGIVLYELTTGHTLFQRPGIVPTVQAIRDAPIPAPSTINASYPRPLERVVLKALSRDPRRRYQTALEMRKDLLRAVRYLATDEPADALAQFMSRHFTERMREKKRMVVDVMRGAPETTVPAAEVDLDIEVPIVPLATDLGGSLAQELGEARGPAESGVEMVAEDLLPGTGSSEFHNPWADATEAEDATTRRRQPIDPHDLPPLAVDDLDEETVPGSFRSRSDKISVGSAKASELPLGKSSSRRFLSRANK